MDQLKRLKLGLYAKQKQKSNGHNCSLLSKGVVTDVTRIILDPKLNEVQRKGLLTQT